MPGFRGTSFAANCGTTYARCRLRLCRQPLVVLIHVYVTPLSGMGLLVFVRRRWLIWASRIIYIEIKMIELSGQPHEVKYHYTYGQSVKPG